MPFDSPPTVSFPAMQVALAEARAAMERGEVPVGAAVTSSDGTLLSAAGNRVIEFCDPGAHAEMLAIREACRRLASVRLVGCDLYVSLEPCAMCAGVVSFARISRLYFAVEDVKGGAIEHGARYFSQPSCHHAPEVYGGIAEREARNLLQVFFRTLRGRRHRQEETESRGQQAERPRIS